ncbi:Protein kinase domain-containing protein [Fusarium falciforme]|uniref:Protein kinase domain-containing protein n=1 Tax=Fusarium falciforme TaxID=195108 RepID=UPI0022FFCF61|nr:Protein kinase domain-containing protein [Fusarium falciforme]WAO83524.1 Protein kinase domain-containing protein [Fusarium falciforme]
MAAASPTPMGNGLVRRTSQRQGLRRLPSRQAMNHNESFSAHSSSSAPNGYHPKPQQFHDDSSEDEIPVPMKLSALTKALLNDGAPESVERPPSPPRTRRRTSALNASTSSATETRRHLRSGSVQAHDQRSSRTTSPAPASRDISPVRKRVVRLSNTPQSLNQMKPTKRRSTSVSRSTQRSRPRSRPGSRDMSSDERHDSQQEINTPAQGGRVVRINAGSPSNRSRVGSTGPSSGRSMERSVLDKSALDMDNDQPEEPATVARNPPPFHHGSVTRYPSTITRTRPEDNANLQSSMRIKRVGKVAGSFLSGPARRGRRRQSEEDGEVNGDGEIVSSQEPESQPADDQLAPSYYGDGIRDFNSGSPVSGSAAARAVHRRNASNLDLRMGSARTSPREPSPREPTPEPAPAPEPEAKPEQNEEEEEEIHYRLPAPPRPELPSGRDQENNAPPSYKRTKPSVDVLLDKIPKRPASVDPAAMRAVSPERKPLASMARNTPLRHAPPPPPKMSVLEAATATAGAATTTQAKQRRNILRVNGVAYTRLDCLGRGGSGKVYRVAAENGKMFALKRVSLENADDNTIKGYLGEIDLLKKLGEVERVIKLFDCEMNTEKQILTLLMEIGELDFNTFLRKRYNPEAAKFDPVFVRFYWKEMLECLQAVHQCDIVHSDLKPANFVLVKGQLKLIDFGIANAIQTDETVNVHRETQVGTPNYMSPESLMDSNNPRGGRMPGRPKLMKLGKPSDIWSLGCILYQMVYGLPPFGHIANQMSRCQAIINWDHEIEFPSRGMGGMSVPPSLIRTMRRCLNREHHMRPTCEELLHESDPFLYPAELTDKALPIDEELLGRIIQSVVTRCRERMPTEAESMSVWPQAYWASVKKAMAGRM